MQRLASQINLISISVGVVQTFDESLDLLCVLALEVKSKTEVSMGDLGFTQFFVDFAEQHGDGGLLGHVLLQAFKHLHCLIVLFQFDQGVSLLILVEPVFAVQGFALLEVFESLCKVSICSQGHTHKGVEYGILAVNGKSLMEVLSGFVVLLLFVANVSEAPPGRVVPYIEV
jgi:hypothetical protein